MCISNFFPKPFPDESYGWGRVMLRSTPIVGMVIMHSQSEQDRALVKQGTQTGSWYKGRMIEYSKCYRLGGILGIILGIALIAFGSLPGAVFGGIFIGLSVFQLFCAIPALRTLNRLNNCGSLNIGERLPLSVGSVGSVGSVVDIKP